MGFAQEKSSKPDAQAKKRDEEKVDVQSKKENPDKNVAIMRKIADSQRKPKGDSETGPIQTKLTVGSVGDKYEREADSTADKVMSAPMPDVETNTEKQSTSSVQKKDFLQTVMFDESKGTSNDVISKKEFLQQEPNEEIAPKKDEIKKKDFLQAESQETPVQKKEVEVSKKDFLQTIPDEAPIQKKEEERISKKDFLQSEESDVAPKVTEQISKKEFLQTVLHDESKDGTNDMVNAKFEFPKVPGTAEVKKPGASDGEVKKGEEGKEEEKSAEEAPKEEAGGEKKKEGVIDLTPPPNQKKSKNKPPKVQKAENDANKQDEDEASVGFESKLKSTKGAGARLPKEIRKEMQGRFGRSFANVRIHTDSKAAELCQEIGARAFTNGCDIYFNTGEFDPTSDKGKKLLAHELTHTIQQGAAGKASIQRKNFEPDGTPPVDTAKPGNINDGKEVNNAGDSYMKNDDNYDPDNVNASVSEMDEDEKEKMNATSGESKEEQSEVNEAGVNKPKEDRGGDALEQTLAEKENIVKKDKEEEKPEGEEEDDKKKEGEEKSDAELAAQRSQEALARAEELADPLEFPEFKTPRIEKPVDADGKDLPGDAEVDTLIRGLAYLGQEFREHAFDLLRHSVIQNKKAFSLDAVLEKQREDLANAVEVTGKADKNTEAYQEVSGLAKGAKEESDVREKATSEIAPGLKGIAAGAMGDSKTMVSDTGGQAKKHSSNLPKDPDARKDAEEQGGDMNDMATGAMTILEAFLFASLSMDTYIQDAIFAKQKNQEGQAEIEVTDAQIEAYKLRNQELKDGNEQTKEEIAQVELGPEDMRKRAASVSDGGYELYAATVVMELELIEIQEKYFSKMKTVKSVKTLEKEAEEQKKADNKEFTADEMAVLAMAGMTEQEKSEYVDDLPEGKEEDLIKALDGLNSMVGSEDEKEEFIQKDTGLANELLGQKRSRVNTGANKALGLENADPRQAEFAPIEEERKKRLNKPMDIADQNMTVLSYKEKEAIAGNLVTDSMVYDVGNMFTWANAGAMAQAMVDPRMMISGVFGGFEKIGNGIVNFSEHWKEDPLGAVLKSGADIATGIATIASTVLGVCAMINGVMLAITIFGWMFPSPITVPSMTWLGTVMTISGYTALIAGALSFKLNQLMYQRNLHQAASATTAREFLGNSLEMKENVSDGAAGLMSVAAGFGGVKMGPGFNMKNVVRGFGSPKRALATMRKGYRGLKSLPKHLAGKAKAGLTGFVKGGRDMIKSLRDGIKALFSKKRNKPSQIRNKDRLDLTPDESAPTNAPRDRDGTSSPNDKDGANSPQDRDADSQPKDQDGASTKKEGMDEMAGDKMTRREQFDKRQKIYDEHGNEIVGGKATKKTTVYNVHGERIMSPAEFKAFKRRIEAMRGPNGEKVIVVQDKFGTKLEAAGQGGSAAAFDPDAGIIYVRNNPTHMELFHESAHAKQWMQQGGAKNYRGNYTSIAREEFVFREIMRNKHLFSPKEILRSQRLIYKYRNGDFPAFKDWAPDPNDVNFWKGVDPDSLPKPVAAPTTGATPPKTGTGKNSMDAMAADPNQQAIITNVESGTIPLEGYPSHKVGNHRRKANYGEMKMDTHFEDSGYARVSSGRVSGVDQKIVKGIDGIYENSAPPPKYVIAESKYGSSNLSQTPKDGPQMSDGWIGGSGRLEKSVGKTIADDIILTGYDRVLVHIDDVTGAVSTYRLNASGVVIGVWP